MRCSCSHSDIFLHIYLEMEPGQRCSAWSMHHRCEYRPHHPAGAECVRYKRRETVQRAGCVQLHLRVENTGCDCGITKPRSGGSHHQSRDDFETIARGVTRGWLSCSRAICFIICTVCPSCCMCMLKELPGKSSVTTRRNGLTQPCLAGVLYCMWPWMRGPTS